MKRLLSYCVTCIVLTTSVSAEEQTIKIGGIFPLTGWGAPFGKSELNASEMAVQKINESEMLRGRRLELIVEDNQSDNRQTISAFHKLMARDKIQVLLGPTFIEFSEIVAPLAEATRVVMITASGYGPNLTKGRNFVFTSMPGGADIVRPVVRSIVATNPVKLTVVVSQNSYFKLLESVMLVELARAGVSRPHVIEMPPDQRDFKSLVTQLRKQKTDSLLLLTGLNGEIGQILKAAREQQVTFRCYANHYFFLDPLLQKNWSLGESCVAFEYFASALPEFLSAYKKLYQDEPMFSAPRAYDNVFLVAQSMRDCGLSADEVRSCLEQVDYVGASGRIQFSSEHTVRDPSTITRLKSVQSGTAIEIEQ